MKTYNMATKPCGVYLPDITFNNKIVALLRRTLTLMLYKPLS